MDQMMAFKTEETVDFYGVNAAWGAVILLSSALHTGIKGLQPMSQLVMEIHIANICFADETLAVLIAFES
jgi:hypothetical protein